MVFANVFDIKMPIIAARTLAIIIVARIIVRFWIVIVVRSSEIAAAEPERDFLIAYKVTKLNPMMIVFVAPIRKRNPFVFWGIISEPIVAACPEPMPGRNAQKGEEIRTAATDLKNSFFGIVVFLRGVIFCFGILDFVLRLIISEEIPNIPERRGINGSLTGRLNAKNPRNPARMKTTRESTKFSSLKIR
ncbi:MAG: hypothetical protein QXS38_00295 [Candidatus Pacearchaeota archaeon]